MAAVMAVRSAHAEPVVIGRYAEVPIGVTQRSPYVTSAADARRSGRTLARAPGASPARMWSIVLPHHKVTPPAVLEDGTLVVGSAGGVYALDPDWGTRAGSPLSAPSISRPR